MPLVDEAAPAALRLYTHPWSRGQIARWALEETGQPYHHTVLGYGTTMKAPEYLALNPMGKVPTLVHEGPAGAADRQVVTECAAICAYLGDTFSEAQLAPPPAGRGAYYRWLFFAAGPLEAATVDRALKLEVPPERAAMVGYGHFELMLGTLEQAVQRMLDAGGWLAGPAFSMADVYVGSHLLWGLQFGSLPSRPAFEAYCARLRERPAYQRGKAVDAALGEALAAQAQAAKAADQT